VMHYGSRSRMRLSRPGDRSVRGCMGVASMSIVDFFRGTAPDYQGRRLDDILAWDDDHLESIHDYIQVLFPLYEPSMFNFRAPLLDEATVAAFRADEGARANLARAFERMLRFYGLRHDAASGKVLRADNFAQKAENWISPFNHNYRRVTRILGSLT